jgi:hypothetical protein
MRRLRSTLVLAVCAYCLTLSPALGATYSAEDLALLAQVSKQGGALGERISADAAAVAARDANASRCLSSLADDAIGVAEATAGVVALVSVDVRMRSPKDDEAAAKVIGTELDGLDKTIENRRQAAAKLQARCDASVIAGKEEDLAEYLDSVGQQVQALRFRLNP